MLGCGPDCESPRFGAYVSTPGTDRFQALLYDWAEAQIRAGRKFYVSPELNSDVFGRTRLGFLPMLAAAVASVAAVAKPVAEIAAVASMVKGHGGGGGKSVSPDEIASAILPDVQAKLSAQGVTLPPEIAQPGVASLLDAFGTQYHDIVKWGLVALGGLVLLRVLRK